MELLPYIMHYEVTGMLDGYTLRTIKFRTARDLTDKEARDLARKRILKGHTFTGLTVTSYRLTEAQEVPFKQIRFI